MFDPNAYFQEHFAQRGLKLPAELLLKKKWLKVARAMSWHIDGVYPENLIDKRRPNEDEERRCFRKDNYEPITMGDMGEAIDGLARIFDSRNYTIRVSDALEAFIAEKRFEGKTFMGWVQSRLFITMLGDPNSIVVVLPGRFPVLPDGSNDILFRVEPELEVVRSENIMDKGDDFLLVKSEKKSLVMFNNKTSADGDIFYLLTLTHVYKIVQTGKKTDNSFVVQYFYPHNLNELPYLVLGGNWNSKGSYFESFFSGCLAWGNEVIKCHSDRMGTSITCAYPTRVVEPQDCPNEECNGGYLDFERKRKCKYCNEHGKVVSPSPYGVYVMPQKNEALGETPNNVMPLAYISPPTDILRFQMEDETYYLTKFRDALHLSATSEAQSGVAKAIDHEREYAWITKIAENVFDHIVYGLLWFMERYMNITNPEPPMIVKPAEFALRSEEDLIEELSSLQSASAPTPVVDEVLLELMKRRYAGNEEVYKKHELLMEYDPLYSLNFDSKIALLGAGVVTKEDVAKSLLAPNELDGILRLKPQTIEYDQYPVIFAALDTALKPKLDALSKDVVPLMS